MMPSALPSALPPTIAPHQALHSFGLLPALTLVIEHSHHTHTPHHSTAQQQARCQCQRPCFGHRRRHHAVDLCSFAPLLNRQPLSWHAVTTPHSASTVRSCLGRPCVKPSSCCPCARQSWRRPRRPPPRCRHYMLRTCPMVGFSRGYRRGRCAGSTGT